LRDAIGPVILISGVGLLLLTMSKRLGRAIDRARQKDSIFDHSAGTLLPLPAWAMSHFHSPRPIFGRIASATICARQPVLAIRWSAHPCPQLH
jgi:hypothetical protein